MIDQPTLDELWDFGDPAASEARFRVELEQGGPWDDTERAELTTQLARAIGLQGSFDEAAALLIEVPDESDPIVGVRVLLGSRAAEFGRRRRDVAQLHQGVVDKRMVDDVEGHGVILVRKVRRARGVRRVRRE